jgi:hypothetical protein
VFKPFVHVVAAPLVGGALLLGCGAASAPRADRAGAADRGDSRDVAVSVEAAALREGRNAWCSYLQALYVRIRGASTWPRFEECAKASTTASAPMMKNTAECSMRVLKDFPGDPGSAEFAALATKCVAEALDRGRVGDRELSSFVGANCGRAAACGEINQGAVGACELALTLRAGNDLQAVIGAISTPARGELHSCLASSSCRDSDRMTSCLVPILDRLLWLPV